MNIKLEKILVKKYPNLYKKYGGDIRETCMGWGFDCGNGWFKLINTLSEKLESIGVVAEQVKEKFGGLRFYIGECLQENENIVDNLIDEAENQSYKICETCGKEGKLRRGAWLTTACNKCYDDLKNHKQFDEDELLEELVNL